jgi:GAD-like domain
MYSKEEFLASFGPPDNTIPVATTVASQTRGRLPDSLIDFWTEYGVGSYAEGTLFLCTPDLFDPIIEHLLTNVPELRGLLAAFAYTAFGDVLLWHVAQRDYILYLQFATFDDQTSRQETDPVPSDINEIYRSAGVEPPADATSRYLANRSRPADLWERLAAYASTFGIDHELGDDGQPLLKALKSMHGSLDKEEVYTRLQMQEGFENVAASYVRRPLSEVFKDVPAIVKIVQAIELNGAQQIVTTEYRAGGG